MDSGGYNVTLFVSILILLELGDEGWYSRPRHPAISRFNPHSVGARRRSRRTRRNAWFCPLVSILILLELGDEELFQDGYTELILAFQSSFCWS